MIRIRIYVEDEAVYEVECEALPDGELEAEQLTEEAREELLERSVKAWVQNHVTYDWEEAAPEDDEEE